MLLVVRTHGKKYIKSVDTLDTADIEDIVSKLLHIDNLRHNVDSTELVIDKSYEIYDTEFVDDPGDYEDDYIGTFWVTANVLIFDDIVHTEF